MRHGGRILAVIGCCGLLSWAYLAAPPALTRGPYLQDATSAGITLVCKTATAQALTLRYGELAGPPWEGEATSASGTTHVFALSALRPETRYEYALYAGSAEVVDGSGAFRTSPPDKSRAPFRFLAWGDSGTGSSAQLAAAARMEEVLPAPTFALGLGDLVYDDGDWADYDPRLFGPYRDLFRDVTFWPTIGNHDVRTENGAPYLDAFYMPTTTGAPGHPSGSELFYSFDHGMAHFACVDSERTSTNPGSAQYEWLDDDLADARARGKRWLFVYMHHPPYTRGTHDSTSEGDLIAIHDNLVPLFDQYDVDMALFGHSHVYERSFLAKSDAVLQADTAEYSKVASPDGTLYLVTGCGGKTGSGPLDHPLMARSYGNVVGFNVLDVSWSEVRGRFVEDDGRTTDLFTLRKENDARAPRVAAVEARGANEVALVFDEPVQAGAGAAGAENVASYVLAPSGAVVSAALQTDQSTVLLGTTALDEDRLYTLEVSGVSDPGGRGADARVGFTHSSGAANAGTPIVQQGATWRYLPGSSAPPAGWATGGFDASAWSQGPAGFGFGDGDDATELTTMLGSYLSVYARIQFQVADPGAIDELDLEISYDDGFVAYLNGVEVARDRVPAGQTNTTPASSSHEAGTFQPFSISPSALVAGTNVLAVEGHNSSLSNNDFSLHPRLVAVRQGAGGAPVSVPFAHVRTANAPATIRFSGERSSDADGPLASYTWDFGDGTSGSGVEVQHSYPTAGLYTVTLAVRDSDGNDDAETLEIRVHEQGTAPVAVLAPSTTDAATGSNVSFASGGSRDPDGGAVTYRWDFGDPASGASNASGAPSPVHRYGSAGTYTVTLVVTDDEGSSATDVAELTVTGSGGGGGGGGDGGGGGGGGCSIRDVSQGGGGDPLLVAVLVLALTGIARGLGRRGARVGA